MKRVVIVLALAFIMMQTASALCTLAPTLVNQDPVSAVPGETVKLLFQIAGTENPECGNINLEFLEDYPFTLDPGYKKIQTIKGGTYDREFNSFWLVPYKVRVDSNALDGDQKLSLKTWINLDSQFAKVYDFNISVKEVRTDFVVTLDSYSFSTKKLVIGIVNIGDKDAQAITIKIPSQTNALIEGGNVKIIGELGSNEDTSATFDASLSQGPINVEIEYNDEIGERRTINKEINFNDLAFESTRQKSNVPIGTIILWLAIIGIIVYLYISRRKARHHIGYLKKQLGPKLTRSEGL
jgi:hypothetical protein